MTRILLADRELEVAEALENILARISLAATKVHSALGGACCPAAD
jgi:hypothetical protein